MMTWTVTFFKRAIHATVLFDGQDDVTTDDIVLTSHQVIWHRFYDCRYGDRYVVDLKASLRKYARSLR